VVGSEPEAAENIGDRSDELNVVDKPGTPPKIELPGEGPLTFPRTLSRIPDDAEIVFSAPWAGTTTAEGYVAREIYVMDSAGDHITQITRQGYFHNHFAVSHDRKKIAAARIEYDTNKNGKIDFKDKKTLWILDLENDQQWPLMEDYDAGWGGVDWSLNDEWIYFSASKGFDIDIYRATPDGTVVENITDGIEYDLGQQLPGKWVSDVSVSFDDEWITFIYAPPEIAAPGEFGFVKKSVVAKCRVDGSEVELLTDGGKLPPQEIGPFHVGDFDPEFSADGEYIIFQRATDVATTPPSGVASHDVIMVHIETGVLTWVTEKGSPATNGISDWSYDDRIVFTEWNSLDGFVGTVLVNADGSDYHRLEHLPYDTGWNRWIPPATRGMGRRDPKGAVGAHEDLIK